VIGITYADCHPGEGRDLAGALGRDGEIPAFAGMTILVAGLGVDFR
jgi:hypothetical protein